MTDWPSHPDDEWVDVSMFGGEKTYLRGRSAVADRIARARAAYLDGAIEIEDYERAIDDVLAECRG